MTSTEHRTGADRLTRFLPLSGVVFAVLAMAGNLTIGDFPDEHTPVSKLTSYYATHHAQVGRGGLLLGWSTVFFAVFGVALWARARSAQPVVAGALLLGTALMSVAMMTSADTYYTLGQVAGRSSTSEAALQSWHISGSVGGVGVESIVLLLAIAAAGIVARALPSWLAWAALVLAVLHFTPMSFVAFLLFYVWAVAAGIALTVKPVTESVPAAGAPIAYAD